MRQLKQQKNKGKKGKAKKNMKVEKNEILVNKENIE